MDEESSPVTLDSAVRLAMRRVDAADAVGISIVYGRRRVHTPAASEAMVIHADQLQHVTAEGPCLDAIWRHSTVYSPSIVRDERWQVWGALVAAKTHFRSVLAFQLFTFGQNLGALTFYARSEDRFTETDRAEGDAVAAEVAVAVASAGGIDTRGEVLDTRTVIATAVGIVMERYLVDETRAFATLMRLSTNSNTRIHELARQVVNGSDLLDLRRGPTQDPPPSG